MVASRENDTPSAGQSSDLQELRRGDQGPEVEELQRYLAKRGYLRDPQGTGEDPWTADRHVAPPQVRELGVLGPETEAALRRFQLDHDLPITGEVDASTAYIQKQPYCNWQTSERVLRVQILGGWEKPELTYGFVNQPPQGIRNDAKDAMADAFKLWSDVIPKTFRFQDDATNVDIEITWKGIDGRAGTLAYAFGPTDGDVFFDTGEPWVYNLKRDGFDIVTVAAHEFGHSLGLSHTSTPSALMYPLPIHRGPHRWLHSEDIRRMQSIYGAKK